MSFISAGSSTFGWGNIAQQVVKIQFEHSHDEGHHSHDHSDSHETAEAAHAHDNEADNSHSHTLVIATAAAIALPDNVDLNLIGPYAPVLCASKDRTPPADLFPGSIFRPPIQA